MSYLLSLDLKCVYFGLVSKNLGEVATAGGKEVIVASFFALRK